MAARAWCLIDLSVDFDDALSAVDVLPLVFSLERHTNDSFRVFIEVRDPTHAGGRA